MENKTGKYFKYAIGEIILVVIGILIALQINNWNENKKKRSLKNEYIISLKNDYTKDTLQLNTRINLNNRMLNNLNAIFDSIVDKHINTIEDFKALLERGIDGYGIRLVNTYNTNSFNLLISSGNVDLLDKQLREEIMELNRLQNFEQEVSFGNRDYFMGFMENISLKYPWIEERFSETDDLYDLLWKGVKTENLSRDLVSYMDQKRYSIIRYIELTEDVLKQTELVLKQLSETDD